MQITYLKGGTFLCIFRTCLAKEIEWNESTRNETAWEIYIDSALEGNSVGREELTHENLSNVSFSYG